MRKEFDEIYYYVCNELYCKKKPKPKGKALSEVIAIALKKVGGTDNKSMAYWKKKITARLIEDAVGAALEAEDAAGTTDDFYCLIDGEKKDVVKGNKKVTLPKGKTPLWVIHQKPEQPIAKRAAFSLAVTLKHAHFLLPKTEREAVKSFVREYSPDVESWLERIDVRPRYIPLFPNSINENRYNAKEGVVIDAITQEKGFWANYQEDEFRIYHPYKLERREWVTYVNCYTPHNGKCKSFAIHRLKFNVINDVPPENFELLDRDKKLTQKYLNSLEITPGIEGDWGKLKLLKIRVSGKPAQHISEMRFHDDAKLSGKTKITAKHPEKEGQRLDWVELEIQDIEYNYEFKCWLLGLGAQVTVLKHEADPKAINHKNINPKRDLIEEAKKILENHGVVIDP